MIPLRFTCIPQLEIWLTALPLKYCTWSKTIKQDLARLQKEQKKSSLSFGQAALKVSSLHPCHLDKWALRVTFPALESTFTQASRWDFFQALFSIHRQARTFKINYHERNMDIFCRATPSFQSNFVKDFVFWNCFSLLKMMTYLMRRLGRIVMTEKMATFLMMMMMMTMLPNHHHMAKVIQEKRQQWWVLMMNPLAKMSKSRRNQRLKGR